MSIKNLIRLASAFLIEASKPVVLVVEDDEDILAMLKLMLEGRGYSVLAANNIEKAIELANSNEGIHSLVTDYHIHGRTATDLLQALGNRKPKNVILLSGKHFAGDPKKEVPGIDSHVSKPFNIKHLVEKINVRPIPTMEANSA